MKLLSSWLLASCAIGVLAGCSAPGLQKGNRPDAVTSAPAPQKWRGSFPDARRTTTCPHPAVKILVMYGVDFPPEATEIFVRPYVVNLYAMEILEFPVSRKLVRDYLEWYLRHLNASDVNGLSGTMYDLYVDKQGKERWLQTYDSADSYGATFFSLLYRYFVRTGDRFLADENIDKLETIAYMMYALLDDDGLSWVWSGHDSKYLMDNCEVYMGLRDYTQLQKELWEETNSRYAEPAERLRETIIRSLFNPLSLNFHFGLDRDGTLYESQWGKFYPDTLAQIYPIAWEVLPADSMLARHLWQQFDRLLSPDRLESEEQRVVARMALNRLKAHGFDPEGEAK